MFLDYFALGLLVFVALVLFYGIIAIHDIPYEIEDLEAEILAARKDLERTSELYAKEVASERSVDQTRSKVDDLQAKLDDARYNLEQMEVRAPSDGFVTQLTLRPGAMALPIGLNPVMTFIHKQQRTFIGWFRQNSLLRLEEGSEAEIVLNYLFSFH